MHRLLRVLIILYLMTGFELGRTLFDRPAPDPRVLTMLGMATIVSYLFTLLWMWGNDGILGMERGLWLVTPWIAVIAGTLSYLLIL